MIHTALQKPVPFLYDGFCQLQVILRKFKCNISQICLISILTQRCSTGDRFGCMVTIQWDSCSLSAQTRQSRYYCCLAMCCFRVILNFMHTWRKEALMALYISVLDFFFNSVRDILQPRTMPLYTWLNFPPKWFLSTIRPIHAVT